MNQNRRMIFSVFFIAIIIAIFPSSSSACSPGSLDFNSCGSKFIVWLSDILRALASTFF
jgi:hypothetical protein